MKFSKNIWQFVLNAVCLIVITSASLCILNVVSYADSGFLIEINETSFPDSVFREYVLDYIDTDTDGYLSQAEIDKTTSINLESKNVQDLSGLEYFTELKFLLCGKNKLTSLDVSKNTKLTNLLCNTNQITSLDISHNPELGQLDCSNNLLTSLDISKNPNLGYLMCSNNDICKIDFSNNHNLLQVSIGYTKIKVLDFGKQEKLHSLNCSHNLLTVLNVSECPSLTDLDCSYNCLRHIDLSGNTKLDNLYCCGNTLAELDVSSNDSLVYVYTNYPKSNGAYGPDISSHWGRGKYGGTFFLIFDMGVEIITIPHSNDSKIIVSVDSTTFPDPIFRQYILENFDLDNDGQLCKSEIDNVKSINVEKLGIQDLSGIEYFPELTILICSQNNLESLDLRENTKLIDLLCFGNKLKELDITQHPALYQLDCSDNLLQSLDISNNPKLAYCFCESNQISSLDFSNNCSLLQVCCGGNQLNTLNISSHSHLHYLSCGENKLVSLSVSDCPSLEDLDCTNNYLQKLDLSGNSALDSLNCFNNSLTELNISDCEYLVYVYNNYPNSNGAYGPDISSHWGSGKYGGTYFLVFDTGVEIETCNHSEIVIDQAVSPTNTTTGLTEGCHCAICGKIIVSQSIIDVITTDSTSTSESLTNTNESYSDITPSCNDQNIDQTVNAETNSSSTPNTISTEALEAPTEFPTDSQAETNNTSIPNTITTEALVAPTEFPTDSQKELSNTNSITKTTTEVHNESTDYSIAPQDGMLNTNSPTEDIDNISTETYTNETLAQTSAAISSNTSIYQENTIFNTYDQLNISQPTENHPNSQTGDMNFENITTNNTISEETSGNVELSVSLNETNEPDAKVKNKSMSSKTIALISVIVSFTTIGITSFIYPRLKKKAKR